PWAFDEVIASVRTHLKKGCILLSVAAGCGLERIGMALERDDIGRMYMIPNTPIRIGKGMSFAAAEDIDSDKLEEIVALFSPITRLEIIDEAKMPAAMALCSCGVAYVYKFIAAAAQAGVEIGFPYDDAVKYFTATLAGAAGMIESSGKSPQELINEVTTPGGITIKGINTLEREGFPSSVIEAIKTTSKS
ncbi:MAG: pyrroline-5-carboxylate reductase, partial [Muribaculaceae bacterium]|nr:pyrroline-5-carboxylate reductase [Muribaculaceae bacterium]